MVLSRVHLVLVSHFSGVGQRDGAAHHEQQVLQTVELVEQVALIGCFIIFLIFGTSL